MFVYRVHAQHEIGGQNRLYKTAIVQRKFVLEDDGVQGEEDGDIYERVSFGDRRRGHLPTVDASARPSGTGYDVPEMLHVDGREVFHQGKRRQEMALPAEELPTHRQPLTWQFLRKVWEGTDAVCRPPVLLVHRDVRTGGYRKGPSGRKYRNQLVQFHS